MKIEVIGFFKEFHDNSRFVKNLNTTFFGYDPQKTDYGRFQRFKTD